MWLKDFYNSKLSNELVTEHNKATAFVQFEVSENEHTILKSKPKTQLDASPIRVQHNVFEGDHNE